MLQEAIDLQQNAVAELCDKVGAKRDLTFRAPTGSGKTRMMADFMNRILAQHHDIIFLVSTLSKGNLAEQNYNVFKACADQNVFPNLNPYLISSESSNEERLFIPEEYNVYHKEEAVSEFDCLIQIVERTQDCNAVFSGKFLCLFN